MITTKVQNDNDNIQDKMIMVIITTPNNVFVNDHDKNIKQ